MERRRFLKRALSLLACLAFLLAACSMLEPAVDERSQALETSSDGNVPTLASTEVPIATDASLSCPVTLPNGSTPPGENPSTSDHGNGKLWTVFWPGSKVIFTPEGPGFVFSDGSLAMKFPWWKGVPGELTIEGRRLDAPAPPLQAEVPDGYSGDFQASSLIFPTEGCWEVTGRVSDASLTFVTLVVRVPFEPATAAWVPEGMHASDFDITGLPHSLRQIYGFAEGGEGELIIETTEGMQEVRDSSLGAAVQQVTVHGQPGICVQGGLDEQGQGLAQADAGFLEWSDGGFRYRISHTGLGLSCQDLLRIAGPSQ